ncbi:MAG TPA: peptidase dimerization domain-containing protein [Ktedonobacteraceae bacterium]|nr:peptidase dimerization domain-containing protein [Ktedonobacteraceae bacterium]
MDEHLAFYLATWEKLYAHLSNAANATTSQSILDGVAMLLQQPVKTRILNEHLPLIYGELATGAPTMLLIYQRYDRHTPDLQAVEEIAALLAALDACQKIAGHMPIHIKWLLDGSDGQDMLALSCCLEEHSALLQADAAIWSYTDDTGLGDDGAHPLLAPGTKGLLSVELTVQTDRAAIDVMHSGIVPNALWRLIWALNSLKDVQEDVKIEGFYNALTPAADSATELIANLTDNALEQRWGTPLMNLKGFQLHYTHFLMPTCTVTTITSKLPENEVGTTLPTQATARVDFQLVPEQDPNTIFTLLRQHLDERSFSDVQARVLFASRPTLTASEHPFVQSVLHATEMAYGQTPYLLPLTVGSYALHPLRIQSNIPIVLIARNEHNSHATFAAMIKQLATIILEGTNYSC